MPPLQKTVISLQTANGVDTKNAPALVDGNKFLLLQNAVFDKGAAGQLHKRNGYAVINPIDQFGNPITDGQALAVFNEVELDLIAGNQFYAQSPEISRFISKGPVQPIGVTERGISENAYNQINADGASLNGVGAYAWEDGRGGVWCTVIDEDSGTIFVPQVQLNAAGSCPKVISNGALLFILCSTTSGQIVRYSVNPANPTSNPAGTEVLVAVGAISGALFEVAVVNGYFAMAYQISIGFEFATYALSNFGLSGSVAESSSVVTAFSVTAVGSLAMVVIGSNASGYVYFFTVPGASLSGVYGSFTAVPSNVANIAAKALSSTEAQVWYQQEPTETADRYIESFQVSTSGSFSSVSVFLRGVGLAAQPLVYNGQTYLLLVYPSVVQQTYFLVNSLAQVVGKFYPLNAGPFSSHARLPIPQLLSTANYSIALTNQVIQETVNGKAVSVTGVTELMLNMAATQLTTAQLGRNLHISTGSMLQEYDGASVTEGGFNVFPEAPVIAPLTSKISINITQQPSLADTLPEIAIITMPSSPASSGLGDGTQIIPGEFFTVGANDGGTPGIQVYAWFTVDGVGADPAFGGAWTGIPIAILSTDTTAEMTTKVYNALSGNALITADWTVSQLAYNQVVLHSIGPSGGGVIPSATQMNTVFYASMPFAGDVSDHAVVQINCCTGALIRPGQAMILPTTFNGFGFFFSVDGYSVYPENQSLAIQVNILSTDSAQMVATKLASAISTHLTATAVGNQVTISSATDGDASSSFTPGPNGIGVTQSYSYVWVYERIDAQGQLEQSSPSSPTQVQLPAFSGVYVPPNIEITGTMLRLTQKQGVDLALYRTIQNGDIYYRDSSVTDLIQNNPAQDYVTTTDQVLDSFLQDNATLYTTGGVVSNDGPPAFTQVIVNNNRLWGLTAEDPQLAWYSLEFQTDEAVSWSNAQTMRFQPTGGPLVSLASMDSTLVAFEQRQIWTVSGDGPDPTGNGGFSGPTLESTATGCRDYASVALTPNGLFFKSLKGFWILDRSFQATQIGLDVYQYNADVVSSAQSIVNSTQIRFLSAAGTPLMFDYQYGQWGTFTNHQGVSSVTFNDVYYYLQASGAIYQEAPGTYQDGTTGFPMLIQTAWLKLDQVQGYGRIWKVFFKGYFPDTNPIQVQTAYNYVNTIIDTEIWNPNAGAGAPVWGGDPTWGFSTPWGGVDSAGVVYPDVLQIRYDPNKQLCEAIQFTIQDLTPYPATETWSLDAIDMEVGVRKGGFKIGTQQRIG